jgi:hypothetical protein
MAGFTGSPQTLGDIAAATSSKLISSKQLRFCGAISPGLDEAKEEDFEDLESVKSGGDPGEKERVVADLVSIDGRVKERKWEG